MALTKVYVSTLFAYSEAAVNACSFQYFAHAYDTDSHTEAIDLKAICVRDAIAVPLSFLLINPNQQKKCA